MSCNVRGIAEVKKRRQIFRFLHEKGVDIALLQETHSTKSKERQWKNECGGRIFFNHWKSNARGTAILIDRNVKFQLKSCYKDKQGRCIKISIEVGDRIITITNLYAPNADDPNFFVENLSNLQSTHDEVNIVGGDFNITLDNELDRYGSEKTGLISKAAHTVNAFLEENDWVDIWRIFNPSLKEYSWYRRAPLALSRLDYCLVPQEIIGMVNECKYIPGLLSDHSFIVLEIALNDQLRGRGCWKMNTSLLCKKEYLDIINEKIAESLKQNLHKNPSTRWEILKMEIVELTQHFSKGIASEKKRKREKLGSKLRTHEKKLACINLKSDKAMEIIQKINLKIDEVREEIEKESLYVTQGAVLRSKTNLRIWGKKF